MKQFEYILEKAIRESGVRVTVLNAGNPEEGQSSGRALITLKKKNLQGTGSEVLSPFGKESSKINSKEYDMIAPASLINKLYENQIIKTESSDQSAAPDFYTVSRIEKAVYKGRTVYVWAVLTPCSYDLIM